MYHVEDETLSIDWEGWKVEIVSLQENAYRSNRPLFYGMELLNKFHNDKFYFEPLSAPEITEEA